MVQTLEVSIPPPHPPISQNGRQMISSFSRLSGVCRAGWAAEKTWRCLLSVQRRVAESFRALPIILVKNRVSLRLFLELPARDMQRYPALSHGITRSPQCRLMRNVSIFTLLFINKIKIVVFLKCEFHNPLKVWTFANAKRLLRFDPTQNT